MPHSVMPTMVESFIRRRPPDEAAKVVRPDIVVEVLCTLLMKVQLSNFCQRSILPVPAPTMPMTVAELVWNGKLQPMKVLRGVAAANSSVAFATVRVTVSRPNWQFTKVFSPVPVISMDRLVVDWAEAASAAPPNMMLL